MHATVSGSQYSSPRSYRILILQEKMRAWELVKSRSILQDTSAVIPYFYCFNILLALDEKMDLLG